eukprot:scaffold275151_cov50-Prasinocladus_malaysianus.AAC.1
MAHISLVLVSAGELTDSSPGWKVQNSPSLHNPFIFFHQRKCSGSTWRLIIANSVSKLKQVKRKDVSKVAYIPCKYELSCYTWTLPSMLKGRNHPYIFAGHFSWGAFRLHAYGWHKGLYHSAHAMTIFREPVSRVVSCLCHRYKQTFPDRASVAQVDPQKLRKFLLERTAFGFGCNNEPLRVLSGYQDEEQLNSLGLPEHHALARGLVEESKQHILSRVVVGLVEHERETAELIKHYFPWLQVPALLERRNFNRKARGTGTPLPEAVQAVILELNAPEVELYKFASALFSREFRRMRDFDL